MVSQRRKCKFLVSACLAGINCTYNSKNNLKMSIKNMVDKGSAVAACPEVIGGLGTPRERSEIVGGDGSDVLNGTARVLTSSGRDVTDSFLKGAMSVLNIIKRFGIKESILKSRSPACGIGKIYDGTFSGKIKNGNGVLTALLIRNNIGILKD